MATAWIATRCGEGAKGARRQCWTHRLAPVTKPSPGASQPGGPSLQGLGRCRALARDLRHLRSECPPYGEPMVRREPGSRRSTLLAQALATAVQAMAITQTGS